MSFSAATCIRYKSIEHRHLESSKEVVSPWEDSGGGGAFSKGKSFADVVYRGKKEIQDLGSLEAWPRLTWRELVSLRGKLYNWIGGTLMYDASRGEAKFLRFGVMVRGTFTHERESWRGRRVSCRRGIQVSPEKPSLSEQATKQSAPAEVRTTASPRLQRELCPYYVKANLIGKPRLVLRLSVLATLTIGSTFLNSEERTSRGTPKNVASLELFNDPLLKMKVHDPFLGNEEKGSSEKKVVGKDEEMEVEKALEDAHEFLNYLLNELVDILEKESHVAKTLPDESLPSGQTANGPRNAPTNGVQREPLVTWVHKNFQANGVFGVGVWKEILKESAWCWDNMVFKVGKGNKIRFWIDPWCGNNVLSQGFPDLFSMAAQRNVTVEEYWDQNLVELRNYRVTVEEDSILWKEGADGLFKVKKAYRVLANAEGAASLIAMFGWTKFQQKLLFLLGKLLGGRFLLWIGYREEGGNSPTGVSYVNVKRKRSIIS
ncbi:Ubiquitin carboxyl-terminal hydrolase 4 [Vitis vinifera]|uniref:Ubiquitin carboxyl-terminal hydrolase 4 n=1 Tax=Vitis vinifera TaxID=29760 RepID=A0A438CC83_VITVI|nr:Ubiquitin carboxyl-terminal hydrolase 4 [Vitis vinifera]